MSLSPIDLQGLRPSDCCEFSEGGEDSEEATVKDVDKFNDDEDDYRDSEGEVDTEYMDRAKTLLGDGAIQKPFTCQKAITF